MPSLSIWDECLHDSIPVDMLDLHTHPTPSDLERRLGRDMVDVFLQTCTPLQRVLFGRDKPLSGPEEDKLWISPVDRLKANGCDGICITQQPSKTECLQALTHCGILELGEKIEAKIASEHEEAAAAAVREAEELERFEANLRIKFHVDEAVRRTEEMWQQRLEELLKNHEEERATLIEKFEENREKFCRSLAQKCQQRIDEQVLMAVEAAREEMRAECTRAIDEELAQQQLSFEQSMDATVSNLRADDRDKMDKLRNQCLRAMDVQEHLLMCRQITEILHAMSVLKVEQKMRENNRPLGGRSSKSISGLWRELCAALGAVNVTDLDANERRLLAKLRSVEDSIDEETSRVFVLEEEAEKCESDRKSLDSDDADWIEYIDECMQRRRNPIANDSSVAVEWQRQEISSEDTAIDDAFMSSIFQRMPPADAGDPEISTLAASLVDMVRTSTDERQLMAEVGAVLREWRLSHMTVGMSSEVIPLPKPASLQIRDSREIIEKAVSVAQSETIDPHTNMLAAIDSLEILTRRTSKSVDGGATACEETLSPELHACSSSDWLPTYMKVPGYKRMTPHEWKHLKFLEDVRVELQKTERKSSISFTATSPRNTSKMSAERHSILKPHSSASVQHRELNQEHNALFPINRKCREALKNMKVKSILNMLCGDDININAIERSSESTRMTTH